MFREGEVLVKMKESTGLTAPSIPEAWVSELASKLRGVNARKLRSNHTVPGLFALTLRPGERVEDKVKELMSNPDVEFAQPNYAYQAAVVPNDPKFSQQWGLKNTVHPGSDIHATAAWDLTTGSSEVVVGVIDTGIDYSHPDLAPNLWVNPGEIPGNGVDDDGDGYVDDVYGINSITGSGDPYDDVDHGTHVSGIIGAKANNGAGISGVNWNVRIMALKFLGPSGGYTSNAVECMDYAVMMKQRGVNIRVLNNSWEGFPGFPDDLALEQGISTTSNNGILFVAAAGNDSNNNDILRVYPASSPAANVIAVAATDKTDNLASFSNYGANSVHVAAPGVDILSTLPGGAYALESGTSMATPFVTGTAALMLALKPELTMAQLKEILMSSADKISGLEVKSGRVNAYTALELLMTRTLALTESQDGAYATLNAAFTVQGVLQYGKAINFYQDGTLVGTASTGSATSATPGVATLTFKSTSGPHTAYAAYQPASGIPAQSDSLNYTMTLPEISGVDKSQGSTRTTVTISGTNFGSRRGFLWFNNQSTNPPTAGNAGAATWTDTSVTFKVPMKKAGSYLVSVDDGLGPSNTVPFTIPLPRVDSVSPASSQAAPRGSVVTVNGQYFGVPRPKVQLWAPGATTPISLAPLTWSDTTLTFKVPSMALGAYDLTVSDYSGASSPPVSILVTVP